jgi:hypothetical protein
MAAPRYSAGCRDQHRLEHLTELRHAEVELDLEHRHADDHTRETEVLDEFDSHAAARGVLIRRLAALMLEEHG